eukprot:GDKJ01049866.1.p1 GENE.GDKJ01049866.1~~GDKJ01049866.1.p1  ORF type:complete len:786 (-),score=37.17 GDKJ01049866.1:32-2389(-)
MGPHNNFQIHVLSSRRPPPPPYVPHQYSERSTAFRRILDSSHEGCKDWSDRTCPQTTDPCKLRSDPEGSQRVQEWPVCIADTSSPHVGLGNRRSPRLHSPVKEGRFGDERGRVTHHVPSREGSPSEEDRLHGDNQDRQPTVDDGTEGLCPVERLVVVRQEPQRNSSSKLPEISWSGATFSATGCTANHGRNRHQPRDTDEFFGSLISAHTQSLPRLRQEEARSQHGRSDGVRRPMDYQSLRPPRFLSYLGIEAPSSKDFPPAPHTLACQVDPKTGKVLDPSRPLTLPLHAKNVIASLDYKEVLKKATGHQSYDQLKESYRWLHDPNIYNACFSKSAVHLPDEAKIRLPDADIQKWIDTNKVSEYYGEPRAFVHIFYVVELAKLRRRGICEPYINSLIERDQLAGISLPTRATIRKFLHGQQSATTLDAAAFYDQFKLDESVRGYFVFEYNNKRYALNVLPMGFRPAADIAHLTAEALLSVSYQPFAKAYIDNFIFTGPNQHSNVQRFLDVCNDVGLVLNELSDYKWNPALSNHSFDFIGESYDLSLQQKSSTAKTRAKLQSALELCHTPSITARQVAAIFGIAIFASSTCDFSLAEAFIPMRYLSHLGKITTDWNTPAPFDNITKSAVQNWLTTLINTKSTTIYTPTPNDHDLEIQVDASAYGWGAVAITKDSVRHFSKKWPESFDGTSSVIAEPMGAWQAVCAATTMHTQKILLRSDHAGLVFAIKNGHSLVSSYNDFIRNTRNAFPGCTIEAQHIAGVDNWLADSLSRPQKNGKEKEERERQA